MSKKWSKILPIHSTGLIVKIDAQGRGIIESSNHLREDPNKYLHYNKAMDGLEALVLAHALAGVDVQSNSYIAGIHTAIAEICKSCPSDKK